MKYYSQFEQDKYLNENIFKNKSEGYFVDIGAYDGVHCSNSLFFEELGWNGICVEPIAKLYEVMTQKRSCRCVQGVISDKDTDNVIFCEIDGYCEMLSGILDDYDSRHVNRIYTEQQVHGGNRKKIEVKNYKFSDIIDRTDIDILDIDTEGNEKQILSTIDYNKYNIKTILVENNYNDQELTNLLINNNFYLATSLGCDQLYINKDFNYE